ncbi:helix-turn-helix domain-containing protein [Streptomyces sp. NPDC059818]|uniref:helix-turn-helix domain-containing protein n=1 Tax=Streptomyces sp. NPDC059818 TaxID=3346962 RepID=UPI00365964F1
MAETEREGLVERQEVQRVLDGLDAIEAMEDSLEKAQIISRLLRDQTERTKRLKEHRRRIVLLLRSRKVTYREIAESLGVSIGTVQDIERGYSGSGKNRPKKNAETSAE